MRRAYWAMTTRSPTLIAPAATRSTPRTSTIAIAAAPRTSTAPLKRASRTAAAMPWRRRSSLRSTTRPRSYASPPNALTTRIADRLSAASDAISPSRLRWLRAAS